jgi:hypothetical protein
VTGSQTAAQTATEPESGAAPAVAVHGQRPIDESAAQAQAQPQLPPPRKRAKRTNEKRGKSFKAEYRLDFGVKVEERDAKTSEVRSVSCRLCQRFGREAPLNSAISKRPLVSSIKRYKAPWRTDNFRQHLRIQYTKQRSLCKASCPENKEAFLDVGEGEIAFGNTLIAHFDTVEALYFWVDRKIVSEISSELLFDPAYSGEKLEAALGVFKGDSGGAASGELKVTVRKVISFCLVIDYVGSGLSFRQACYVLRATAERTVLHKLKGVIEQEVCHNVRVVVGINLQKTSFSRLSAGSTQLRLMGPQFRASRFLM